MEDKRKIWLAVVVAAIVISILLRFTILEVNTNGLSILAVSLGFCSVGALQCVSVYITEKLRGLSQDQRETFWKW
jgi:hypothetical protein